MKFKFTKMHGAGNDFILVDARNENRNWAALAPLLCHRHLGIGADQLILAVGSEKADVGWRLFNVDGVEAEMCGNGLRCFAKFVYDAGIVVNRSLTVETMFGVVTADLLLDAKGIKVTGATVSLPRPVFLDKRCRIDLPSSCSVPYVEATLVSVGNPHAVLFLKPGSHVNEFPLKEVGPLVENHTLFLPKRINFHIVEIVSETELTARHWERSAGETLACGSGSCACVIAARNLGFIPPSATVKVNVPGGLLQISFKAPTDTPEELVLEQPVTLEGPAATVFEGLWVGSESELVLPTPGS